MSCRKLLEGGSYLTLPRRRGKVQVKTTVPINSPMHDNLGLRTISPETTHCPQHPSIKYPLPAAICEDQPLRRPALATLGTCRNRKGCAPPFASIQRSSEKGAATSVILPPQLSPPHSPPSLASRDAIHLGAHAKRLARDWSIAGVGSQDGKVGSIRGSIRSFVSFWRTDRRASR